MLPSARRTAAQLWRQYTAPEAQTLQRQTEGLLPGNPHANIFLQKPTVLNSSSFLHCSPLAPVLQDTTGTWLPLQGGQNRVEFWLTSQQALAMRVLIKVKAWQVGSCSAASGRPATAVCLAAE